jgi:hypothetical protein
LLAALTMTEGFSGRTVLPFRSGIKSERGGDKGERTFNTMAIVLIDNQ